MNSCLALMPPVEAMPAVADPGPLCAPTVSKTRMTSALAAAAHSSSAARGARDHVVEACICAAATANTEAVLIMRAVRTRRPWICVAVREKRRACAAPEQRTCQDGEPMKPNHRDNQGVWSSWMIARRRLGFRGWCGSAACLCLAAAAGSCCVEVGSPGIPIALRAESQRLRREYGGKRRGPPAATRHARTRSERGKRQLLYRCVLGCHRYWRRAGRGFAPFEWRSPRGCAGSTVCAAGRAAQGSLLLRCRCCRCWATAGAALHPAFLFLRPKPGGAPARSVQVRWRSAMPEH